MRTTIVVLFLLAGLINNSHADPSSKGDKGATSGPKTPVKIEDKGAPKKEEAPVKGANPDTASSSKDRH
jgi:hypothetical protein